MIYANLFSSKPMKHILTIAVLFSQSLLLAQTDSVRHTRLKEVTVKGYRLQVQPIESLPAVYRTYLTVGKKNDVIDLQDIPANLAEKTGRQIFAKIPGTFVYDMDGSGNQTNVSTRGLDPHRSWEYNVRQNGIITNSDIYGYPASHYSAPMEAVARIEIIRGTASLQYGSQFGGMVNYVTKPPDTTRSFGFESLTSVGSYGLFSSYNAIGGRIGKITYQAYYQRRNSSGYRTNAASESEAQFASVGYAFSKKLHVRAELGRSTYLYRVPGPLTDSLFYADPRQATRSRNYFKPDIYIPSLTLNWQLGGHTHLSWVNSAVLGTRSSLQFIGFANQPDTINRATRAFANRQVDIDGFNSYTSELRLSHQYRVGRFPLAVVSGVRYVRNNLHRQQLGRGSTGTEFDLALVDGGFGRDLRFKTQNIAFFAENMIHLTSRLSLSAGMRYENGISRMSGLVRYLPENRVPVSITHRFPLWGAGAEYRLGAGGKLYGGWSQAYRPVIFADIIPPTALDRIDPALKDARGYNLEAGIKGDLKGRLTYDLSLFQINYRNRIGTLAIVENGQNYTYKTNTGNTLTNGAEMYLDWKAYARTESQVSVFTATSWFDARYRRGNIVVNRENRSVEGNRVEGVPAWISRSGIQYAHKTFAASLQYSYVSTSYADALNTAKPNATGVVGTVPAYGIWDFNCVYRFRERYVLRFGVNNFANRQYFTKRPTMYPGPGVWSSDGRSVVAAVGIRI